MLEYTGAGDGLRLKMLVLQRFLLRTRSNSAKTIIDPTTATEAAIRIRNTATIDPLKIAIRSSLPAG
jgi:hypothetical protein